MEEIQNLKSVLKFWSGILSLFRNSKFVLRIFQRPITWILVLAFLLRLWGVTYALPQFFVNDERAIVYGALEMYKLKTIVPAWHAEEFKKVLSYLPVSSYLLAVAMAPVLAIGYLASGYKNLATFETHLILDSTLIFLAARAAIALLGVLTIYLAYRFTRELFSNERAGWLAALFLTFSFYHLQLSHVTRHWMPALACMSFAWLSALHIFRNGRARDYVAAGFFAALAVGANTAGAVVMIPVVLAHLLRQSGKGFLHQFRSGRLWLGILVCAALSLLLVSLWPYGLSQGEVPGGGAGSAIANKVQNLSEKSIGEWLSFLSYYVRLLLTYEPALFVAAVGGLILAFRRNRTWVSIALAFMIAYFTALYLFFNIIPRGVVFVLPMLAVFAGYAVDRLLTKGQIALGPRTISVAGLFGVSFIMLFLAPLATAFRYDYLLTQPDSRSVAENWIYANTPRDAKILADLPSLRITNTKQGIETLGHIDPGGLRVQDRTLLALSDSEYPGERREVLNLHFISAGNSYRAEDRTDFFLQQGYTYFVVEYEYADGRDLDSRSRAIARSGKLIRRFSNGERVTLDRAIDISGEIDTVPPRDLFFIDRFGVFVDVYKL